MAKKHATLIINNNERFCNDIWQYDNEFTVEEWKAAIRTLTRALNKAYKFLDAELYNANGKEIMFPDDALYQIGDTINLLKSIDIKVK